MAYIEREMQFDAGDWIIKLFLSPYIKGKATTVEIAGKVS